MTTTKEKPTFWQWFDSLPDQYAKDHPEVSEYAKAHNFTIGHTGGGCLALEQTNGKCWLLICDEGNALPTTLDQCVIAGSTDVDEGTSIIGLDKVTTRDFLATCWTFAALSEIYRKRERFEESFPILADALREAIAEGCVHPDEAEAVKNILAD